MLALILTYELKYLVERMKNQNKNEKTPLYLDSEWTDEKNGHSVVDSSTN